MKILATVFYAFTAFLMCSCSKPEMAFATFVFTSAPNQMVREEIKTIVEYEKGKGSGFFPVTGQPINGFNGNERFQVRIKYTKSGTRVAEVLLTSGTEEKKTEIDLEHGQQVVELPFDIRLNVTPNE